MYQVVYGSNTEKAIKKGRGRRWILTGVFFLLFCMMVYRYFPEGEELLQALLIPGDPEITLQAAEVFAAELGSGYALRDALGNFCSAVLGQGHGG